ncbi:oligosaccharide reducing-end xylanase [Lachnotalea glycerini]|uniref:Oligosaccharide reducing-end xylanase n=1 Tax=Lachnotalea glycerini TaxID=1763509 RepID=A0A318ER89_9FIRM|nr:glycosyl hydrolase family 8 [Lachnotalea glycerini]OYP34206.1 xylanase [Lachnotalea glycerini]PXV89211.1 oligosaccharide reducing-end xylanase [Lachnotalea glycerini]
MQGAYDTGIYRNVLLEYGYTIREIEDKLNQAFEMLFYGTAKERIYHTAGDDRGYIEDTGNHDVRTEGMSYGMMMCVQMNKKLEFDCLWKWAKTYMYMKDGENAGFFAWSCQTNGEKNAWGPAPDGEEYFAMALFFAANRWGDGEGIFCYSREAKEILHTCIHKGEHKEGGRPMWEPSNKLIKFITECDFTDPSYHLPHFYELFSLWGNEEDSKFWEEAAKASRSFLKKACHIDTGLCAEYTDYDGRPKKCTINTTQRHDWYYSDAYRTIANIGLDYSWFAKDEWESENADRLQKFFSETGNENGVYLIDGTQLEGVNALHPIAIIATNAQASLAAKGVYAKACVERFWNTPLRTGDRRYYDNCLYFFALLSLSGKFRIWK